MLNPSVSIELLTILIEAGADVQQVDNAGRNVLFYALGAANSDVTTFTIVEFLIKSICLQNQSLMVNQSDT